MHRSILAAFLLVTSSTALASEEAAKEQAAAEGPSLEELEANRKSLVEARDAALIKANTYGLPKYRLEAQEKQEEIDRIDAMIESAKAK